MQAEVKVAEAETVLHLKDDFYRDGFRFIWLSIVMTIAAIILLIMVSLYFFLNQVLPINFSVYDDFRVQPDIPVDRPYMDTANLVQWGSTVIPKIFSMNFINYNQKLKEVAQFFTPNGWEKYGAIVKTAINLDELIKNKVFVTASADGAPVVLNQGLIEGRYAWWLQIPVEVHYSGIGGVGADAHATNLIVQFLVVRVPTLDNLDGIRIENMIANQK